MFTLPAKQRTAKCRDPAVLKELAADAERMMGGPSTVGVFSGSARQLDRRRASQG